MALTKLSHSRHATSAHDGLNLRSYGGRLSRKVHELRSRPIHFVLALAAAVAWPPAASAAPDEGVFGVWANPKETVHVDIRPCGPNACGVVVWASPEAEAKVLRVSGKKLLGLEIFHDMVRTSAGIWRGRAYAPDLDMSFTGFARAVDGLTLRTKGCLVGKLLCRSQDWKRVQLASTG